MIAHQGITDDGYMINAFVSAQKLQVDCPLMVVEKDRLAVIAALSDVVGPLGQDYASHSYHRPRSFAWASLISTEKGHR